MSYHSVTAALVISALTATVASAQSARNCGERTKIVERLQSHYGEARTGAGLTPNNGMMEIFASDEKGTWTILITMPSGMSCLLAAGQDWQGGPPELTKSGAPA